LIKKDSVDDAGNVWMVRLADNQGMLTLDCMRPDGTWITPPLPPLTNQLAGPFPAIKPYGNMQAYLIVIAPDLTYHLHRFNGSSWTDLGAVPFNAFIDDLDFAPDGTIWVCGTGQGGAIRRDPVTGFWQRYRVTNTSQFDFFNNDLTISPQTGDVYACANAGSGVGGMVKFDGTRWTGWNDFTYGLGNAWPFLTDNSQSILVRPSNGHLVVNPTNNFTHEFDGTTWSSIPGAYDQMSQYLEDSLGRLWGVGHSGGVWMVQNNVFTPVGDGTGNRLHRDPDRAGTMWIERDRFQIERTDGTYSFSRGVWDFPEIMAINGNFTGLAADHNGVAWVGSTATEFGGAGGTLIRLDATTGAHQMWQHDLGWPFPGVVVSPQLVTPDGRVWMTYAGEDPIADSGLLAWDDATVVTFPAPPNGVWQRGGLPHHIILDMEVKIVPNGYELWMSCVSRGIAVLSVTTPACPADFNHSDGLTVQDIFDFLNAWFAGAPAADFNHASGISVQDIFDFLNAWFAGC
jgi:hypothetical protein